ncbi:hypothetical protein [Nocardioides nitrophenolicus]|uniref:hypothetical protein n=1 Tax=Nocardioides nitrophenolicus TaxID=60489 RepID=UPI001957E2D8|nr:hypothetical protein [Nocardioides nitrophenolicus]MBM7516933.1 hypothetical protein [Nocardioides nitrophenolicus]
MLAAIGLLALPGPLPGSADLSAPTGDQDVIEVWVCTVPLDTRAHAYQPSPLRLDLDPAAIAGQLEAHVRPWFATLSNGRYAPRFVAGGVLALRTDEGGEDCLARAQDRSRRTTDAVLAVANAEHRADAHGGLGNPGAGCASEATSCPASVSRRGAYVGASDFHPDWGPLPAFDLIEHELGHTLGWPHSGGPAGEYDSALDVMSDSTAPRSVFPDEHHAGGTIGINLVDAGWIPARDVVRSPRDGGRATYRIHRSAGPSGTRLLELPLAADRFLTVELLTADGLDRHLPESGIAITLVDASPAACGTPCDPLRRRHVVQRSTPPYTDLLQPGEVPWSGHGWRVQVDSIAGGTATVSVTGPDRRS